MTAEEYFNTPTEESLFKKGAEFKVIDVKIDNYNGISYPVIICEFKNGTISVSLNSLMRKRVGLKNANGDFDTPKEPKGSFYDKLNEIRFSSNGYESTLMEIKKQFKDVVCKVTDIDSIITNTSYDDYKVKTIKHIDIVEQTTVKK